jgi:hypothetical protein
MTGKVAWTDEENNGNDKKGGLLYDEGSGK